MSACRHYAALISRYIDNDLEITESKSFEEHLAGCERCRRALNSFTQMKRLVVLAHADEPAGVSWWMSSSSRVPSFSVPFMHHTHAWQLAALFFLVIAIGGGIVLHPSRTQHKIPVVMQHESRSLFNTPLGALMYYEELAGTTIHAQYSRIDTALQLACSDTNALSNEPVRGYSSDLFQDNSYIAAYYSIVRN